MCSSFDVYRIDFSAFLFRDCCINISFKGVELDFNKGNLKGDSENTRTTNSSKIHIAFFADINELMYSNKMIKGSRIIFYFMKIGI